MPLIGSASSPPATPPSRAIATDSERKDARTLRGAKPRVSSTAISGVRDETAAYIVFTAPKTAPTAMTLVIMMARKVRIRVRTVDCPA